MSEQEAKIKSCNSEISLVEYGMVGGSSFGAPMNLAATSSFSVEPQRPKLTLKWRGKTTPVPDLVFVDVTAPARPAHVMTERVLRVDPFVELSGLAVCLGHWRTWMRQDDRDLGVKGQAGLSSCNDDEHEGYDTDMSAEAAEAVAARAEREIALATDAMISSLDRHYKAAIYRSNNIASVWRFPNLDFVTVLPEAEAELTTKLSKNVATRAFF